MAAMIEITISPLQSRFPEQDMVGLRRRIMAPRFPGKETVATLSKGGRL